eukprot:15445169-Alexandrium_andersonii.AAC.1
MGVSGFLEMIGVKGLSGVFSHEWSGLGWQPLPWVRSGDLGGVARVRFGLDGALRVGLWLIPGGLLTMT